MDLSNFHDKKAEVLPQTSVALSVSLEVGTIAAHEPIPVQRQSVDRPGRSAQSDRHASRITRLKHIENVKGLAKDLLITPRLLRRCKETDLHWGEPGEIFVKESLRYLTQDRKTACPGRNGRAPPVGSLCHVITPMPGHHPDASYERTLANSLVRKPYRMH
jgi:hypothetical protein